MTPRRVLYVQYTNPAAYPPLEHSALLLADAGFDVHVMGTSILGDALRLPSHPRVRVSLMPFQSEGWRQKAHYLRFAAWVTGRAASWRPSWIYASDPNACQPALMARRLSGARLLYHEHDSPDPGRFGGSWFSRATAGARRRVARIADLCVLPNEQRARRFAAETGSERVLTVWNCPTRSEAAGPRATVSASRLRVLYHGSITPARLPESIVEAIAMSPDEVSLVVTGYDTEAGYSARLAALARRLGAGSRVEFTGPMSRAALMRHAATCDVGLVVFATDTTDANEQSMVGASNKAFDYLACGLPVLVADRPEWRATFVDAGFGRACDPASAESVAAAVGWFLDHPADRQAMADRGRCKIATDWNYERLFAPVLSVMNGSPIAAGALAGVGAA